MKSNEINSKLTISEQFKSEMLKQKGMVTQVTLVKNFKTGTAEAIRIQYALLGGKEKGELLIIEVPVDKISEDINQGDCINIVDISGVRIRGISREGSTYVDYQLVIEGAVSKDGVK